jgi:hypothetical protein
MTGALHSIEPRDGDPPHPAKTGAVVPAPADERRSQQVHAPRGSIRQCAAR